MTPDYPPLDILLLSIDAPHRNAQTILDHRRAFRHFSAHRVRELSDISTTLTRIAPGFELDAFDVLVIHYSNFLPANSPSVASTMERIRSFRGLKVLFVQDEYREVLALHERIRDLGIDVLFTCVPEGEITKVYPPATLPSVRVVNTLTGYVPAHLLSRSAPRADARPVDVGYRARAVPFWLGSLAAEKWQIAERFAAAARGAGLRLDISCDEADRLYGRRWDQFLTRCRTVLGVESGASVFDFSGDIRRNVEAYVGTHPQADFETVRNKFLLPYEGKIELNQISPRCFEAAALRTGQVLYEGRYSGILLPWRHYVPLRKDFANFPEVADAVRDTRSLQSMIDCAYEEVACNPSFSYRQFVGQFDRVVSDEVAHRSTRHASGTAGSARIARYRMRSGAKLAAYRTWNLLPVPIRRVVRDMLTSAGLKKPRDN